LVLSFSIIQKLQDVQRITRLPHPDKPGFAMTITPPTLVLPLKREEILKKSVKIQNKKERWIPDFSGMT